MRELVETGEIAELAAFERELAPNLVGLGDLGLSANRSVDLARSLGVRTAAGLREEAACRACRGSGQRPRRSCSRRWPARPSRDRATDPLLNRAWELVGGIAAALDGEAVGDVRRWRD